MTYFEEYYSKYMNTLNGFNQFHNEVINMPRDEFSSTGIKKIRTLAGYLLLTEGKLDIMGVTYKDTMQCIHDELRKENFPVFRDKELEHRYFDFNNIDYHYDVEGRMFRHLMGLCAFFGFVKSISRNRKVFDYDKCREYYLSDDAILIPVARNNIMMLNAGSNDYIKALNGISITDNTDYRPTYAILRYISEIHRPVTKFELSILLGRIDETKSENEILKRALTIGAILPTSQDLQIPMFFNNMGWSSDNGVLFEYANSQEPHFKFNNYLLLLEAFELIKFDNITCTYILTSYAEELLADDVSYLIADLEKLIILVDNYDSDNGELNNLIIHQRNPELLRIAREDDTFITKMNQRSMNNIRYDQQGKKLRNRLVAELCKVLADYKCEYAQRHIFKMPNGKYYCEAHHIIEFSNENGPDITNNLICLGPEAHMIIHHACKEEVDDLFYQLRVNGVITIDRFEEMITIYHCLTKEHIEILYNKRAITNREKEQLLELLAA